MSYILDALSKSSAESTHDPVNPALASPATGSGLTLPWKLAIAAVLAANFLLLYLWRSDASTTTEVAQPMAPAAHNQNAHRTQTTGSTQRPALKTLPGIASPRDLSVAPPPPATQASSAAPRTFKPSGRAITIAEAGAPQAGTAPGAAAPLRAPAASNTPPPQPSSTLPPAASGTQTNSRNLSAAEREAMALATIAELESQKQGLTPSAASPTPIAQAPQPTVSTEPTDSAGPTIPAGPTTAEVVTGRDGPPPVAPATPLHQLDSGPRQALNALNFSTHIYGSAEDLRAVVVNGQRLTAGKAITADGHSFTLLQVTDDGVVLEFDYDGVAQRVLINGVMEDWQDA